MQVRAPSDLPHVPLIIEGPDDHPGPTRTDGALW
jgi:hypothetical protein